MYFQLKGLANKRLCIFEWLKQQHLNICILQERHCKKELNRTLSGEVIYT